MRMYANYSIDKDGILIIDTNRALMESVSEIGYCEHGANRLKGEVNYARSEAKKNRTLTGDDNNELVDLYHDVIEEIANVIECYHQQRVAIKRGEES